MFAYNVPFEDFEKRRLACQKEAVARGLSGVFVCSRGGGTFDRYVGGNFFANHYQQRCYLPDNPPFWSGRSHSLLLIPAEGESVLLVTTKEYRKDLVGIKDIRYSKDFHKLIADVATELSMNKGDVGIISEDVLTHRISRQMFANMPSLKLVPCDDILTNMQLIKTPRERESIKRACEIGSEAVRIIMAGVEAGKTESEVLGPSMNHIYSHGAALYFVVTNSGPNSDPVHSIDFPGFDCWRKLEKGDLFKVDLIIVFEGYICDFGRTTVVGGESNEIQRKMITEVTEACEYFISHIKPGALVSDIVKKGDKYLEKQGISLASDQTDPREIYAAFPPHWGHGIGMTWERPWFIKQEEMAIEENMYLAVEKCLYKPGIGTVNFEQNVLVTSSGCEIVTTTDKFWI